MQSAPDKLRVLLARDEIIVMPCCFDPLSAKLIEQGGFPLSFMSGFAASAARLGLPDTGLMSYAEVLDQGRNICNAVTIPVIGDGDTGYGNALNVKRTVQGFAQAGFSAIMIEDQLAPKRCGHTAGKSVVNRAQAMERIQAAVDARAEGHDILILARTDARHDHGLAEAIERAAAFHDLGADILFIEAPQTEAEMRTICAELPGLKMVNIIDGGLTPNLPPEILQDIGFAIAAYPITLIAAAMQAMKNALSELQSGVASPQGLMPFDEVKTRIGFDDYFEAEKQYARLDDDIN